MLKKILVWLWVAFLAGLLAIFLFFFAVAKGWVGYVPDMRELADPEYKFASQVFSADGVELQPKLGMRGALTMSLCWYDALALQMELAYVYNKIEGKMGKSAYDVKSNVMEIPIMFSYRGLWPMRFNAGPVLSLAGTGRYSTGREKLEFGNLRTTVGYTAGVGVNISDSVVLDARFTGNFGRTDNYFEGVEFGSSSYWVGLNIGYMF